MKQPFELPPTIVGGRAENTIASPATPEYHQHYWRFATVMPHQRKHVITEQTMTMLSLLMICTCGAQLHSWVAPPPEPQADVQREVAQGMRTIGKPS